MSEFFSTAGLPEIVAGIAVLALNAYALLGGGDFGGGVWDLLASGPRRDAQRALIANAIAPIWEANHVWLIVVVVVMFTAFPAAFAALSIVLHIPLTIMLVGIVLRGSAFMFRSYGSHTVNARDRWGAAFAGASVVTPIVLGIIIGAISSGAVARAATAPGSMSFADTYVRPWWAPFPLAVGGFTLAIFSFLAAIYATVAARDDALREDFRARALGSAVAVLVFAALSLLLARAGAPRIVSGVAGSPWSLLLHVCTGSAAVVAIAAVWRRRYGIARVAAALQVSLILWGWAFSEYPYLIPDALTIRAAAAPFITLRLLLIGLAAGAAILVPSLRYMLRTFAARS
ncbi:MAG: cytochrome d ubiquinol oxidase subunit II [Gemmatimonadaceae bacterium]